MPKQAHLRTVILLSAVSMLWLTVANPIFASCFGKICLPASASSCCMSVQQAVSMDCHDDTITGDTSCISCLCGTSTQIYTASKSSLSDSQKSTVKAFASIDFPFFHTNERKVATEVTKQSHFQSPPIFLMHASLLI